MYVRMGTVGKEGQWRLWRKKEQCMSQVKGEPEDNEEKGEGETTYI